MDSGRRVVLLLLLLSFVSNSVSRSITQIWTRHRHSTAADPISSDRIARGDDVLYCDSWRLSVETNNAGQWSQIPAGCVEFVEDYVTGDRYRSDSEVVADDSLAFAKTVNVTGDGYDAWVFDIDETLLSNVAFYQSIGFGSDIDVDAFYEWVDLAEAPALPASLRLYKDLEQLGFKIFLLTGRSESIRNATTKNLLYAGYSNWEKLILRGPSDSGTLAVTFKSEKRMELEDEGYKIHGSSGDQWSDLLGFAVAKRSFKLPNPMYYVA